MKRKPSLKSVMTPFPYAIEIDAPIGEAEAMMAEHGFRHLPVTDEGRLVGVVAERDVGLLLGVEGQERRRRLRVRDASVLDAYVVELHEPLERVLSEMAERRIGSALVTRRGKLVGIFTASDACRSFADLLRKEFPEPGPDEVA